MLNTLLVLSRCTGEGSIESNYPDHKFKNIAYLAISAIMRFNVVQRGLMHLDYSELVHKSNAYLVAPSKNYLEEIR